MAKMAIPLGQRATGLAPLALRLLLVIAVMAAARGAEDLQDSTSASPGDCSCAPSRDLGPALQADGGGARSGGVELRKEGLASKDVGVETEEVKLRGGHFTFGASTSPYPEDREGPAREVQVQPFSVDATEVTNEAFGAFVAATGYRTDAEQFGWSFVYEHLLEPSLSESITRQVAASPWWLPVEGADWAHPEGPATDVVRRGQFPAVHISWNDATAYCEWMGKRLPSEQEWEYAARGGKVDRLFPWGNNHKKLHSRANTFTGSFPNGPTTEDGWLGPAPVRSYEPNAFGMYETIGNVWEWTSSPFFPQQMQSTMKEMHYTQRGGSFMCHRDHCYRYRCSARSPNTPDSSASNNGFRCARSLHNQELSTTHAASSFADEIKSGSTKQEL